MSSYLRVATNITVKVQLWACLLATVTQCTLAFFFPGPCGSGILMMCEKLNFIMRTSNTTKVAREIA